MKIKRLDLKAYGHFTDCVIELTSETPGLHIIYGLNEAGKSTSLRALQGLLYGIHSRTPDNFLHDYRKLMIGGHLENSDGKEINFWRRKKNIGDLQDSDHNIINQSVLSEFLHGIDKPLFEALFGIDHETLVSGGRDILEQKGDIGQALFSAGAGLSSLHNIIENLEKESEGLFKSRGSIQKLNQAINAHQEIKSEIRNLSLSSSAWAEQKEIFDNAFNDQKLVEEQKRVLGAERERLKRLQLAIPKLAKRVELKQLLSTLGSFSHLPQDFPEQLEESLETRKQVENVLREAESRKKDLEIKKKGISLRQDILDQAETINNLHQQLGIREEANNERSDLKINLIESRTQAETLLNQVLPALDLSQTDTIRELLSRRATIQQLGNSFAGFDQAMTLAAMRVKSLNGDLQGIASQLEVTTEVGNLLSLRVAIDSARGAGDLDTSIRNLKRDIGSTQSFANADMERIGLWSGSPEELLSLTLPSTTTIEAFIERYRESSEVLRQNRQQQTDVKEDRERVICEIDTIEKAGSVATEDDLNQSRERRDKGWQLIKRTWLNDESLELEIREYDENKDLPGAFERVMYEADDVSDQLRASADRVHLYASLLAKANRLERQEQRLIEESVQLTVDKELLEHEWQATWNESQIGPLSPNEMRTWIDQCQEVIRSFREGEQKETERQALAKQRQQLISTLSTELEGVGQVKDFTSYKLTSALNFAEEIYNDLKATQDKRSSLLENQICKQEELTEVKHEFKTAKDVLNTWRQQWDTELEGFALPDDATVDDATNALEILRTILDKTTKMTEFENRLDDIDQHTKQFEASVKALIQSVAPELDTLPPDQAVTKLLALAQDAREDKATLDNLVEDLDTVNDEIRQARVDYQAAEGELASLRELARCDDDGSLLRIKSNFQEYQEIQSRLASLEDDLLGVAEGVGLDELEEQRQVVDPNELPGQIDELNRRIQDELEPQIILLSERRGGAQSELQRMDGRGNAAAMADKAQAALAKVRRLADRYIRLRLGNQLLKKEIERYRQENQDPILKVASRYFADLTLTSFSGLRSDIDDHGNPILVGICPNNAIKTVDEMSSGTRDQLYLALRLATLEWRLEKHEPMPFIADDILVNFDDERSTATLKALAELARKNQVILFTHHRQIVETVKGLDMDGHVVIHPLNIFTADMH